MRVGIIGAGQLGQMLGFAGRGIGITCRFLDPADTPPAADAGEVIRRPFDDAEALADLAASCDVITYEFENVPVEALLRIAGRIPVFPPPEALRSAQDRLAEKRLFDELQIPLPRYRAVDSLDDLQAAVDLDSSRSFVPVDTANSPHRRISMTLSALLRSDEVLLLISGAEKRAVLEQAAEPDSELPIAHLLRQRRTPVDVFWAP